MSSLRPSERRRSQRRLVIAAITLGVVALGALAVIMVASLLPGDRPEETVASRFLEAFYAGDAAAAYHETAPSYRRYVFEQDLGRLSDAVADAAGPTPDIDIVGSARDTPATSLVGYRGEGINGAFRGAVSLANVDDRWYVVDVSFRFPDAPAEVSERLDRVVADLNEGIAGRTEDQVEPGSGGS